MTKKSRFDQQSIIHYSPPSTALQPWEQQPATGAPPVTWGYRERPAGKTGTLESDVYVPTLQAVFVGLAWGVVAGLGAALLVAWQRWSWGLALLALLATWAGVVALHITGGVRLRQALLWQREELERKDLDGDGIIGRPDPVTVRVELSRATGQGRQTKYLDLDVEPAKLATFARAVLGGRGLAVNDWAGRGGLFSRGEFERLRNDLLERGLVRWQSEKDKRQGASLTPAGAAVFRRLVEDLSPTTGDGQNWEA